MTTLAGGYKNQMFTEEDWQRFSDVATRVRESLAENEREIFDNVTAQEVEEAKKLGRRLTRKEPLKFEAGIQGVEEIMTKAEQEFFNSFRTQTGSSERREL